MRTVDQFSGTVTAPEGVDEFWAANRRADDRLAQERELRAENARLTRDNIMLRQQVEALLSTGKGELLTRIDELEDRLRDIREAGVQKVATANVAGSRGREL